MKANKLAILLILVIITLTGCQQVDVVDQSPDNNQEVNTTEEDLTYLPMLSDQYMKGYELYSWQEGESWNFSLLVATDRIKSAEEIQADDFKLGSIEELLSELGYLQQGEDVFWSGNRVSGTALPPDSILNQVSEFCRERGIQLNIER